jgi:integrase
MAKIRKRTRDGRTTWLADHRDGSGARRFRSFSTRREAELFLAQAITEVRAGAYTPDSASITIAKAAELWLLRAERDGLARSTLDQYRQHVNLHIAPLIGGMKLSQLTGPAVANFIDQLRATRSRALAGKILTGLSGILAEAQARGLVGKNVARDARGRLPKRDKARPEMPTSDELRAIVAHAEGRWRPFIITAIFTGLRGSELRALRWSDIDLKVRRLTVSSRADLWGDFGSPKSAAGNRDVPLAPIVVNSLREWKLVCPPGELGLVFPNGAGKPESHANILNRGFWPLQIKAGVTVIRDGEPDAKYSLHALRHAAAALFIQQGFGPKKIQSIMGHASITLTFDTYGYLLDRVEDDTGAVEEMQVRLLGLGTKV